MAHIENTAVVFSCVKIVFSYKNSPSSEEDELLVFLFAEELFGNADGIDTVFGVCIGACFACVVCRDDSTADDGLCGDACFFERVDGTVDLGDGRRHQRAETDEVCLMFFCGGDDCFRRDVFAEVDDLKAIIFKQQLYDIFADIVDIALNGCENKRAT